MISGFVCTGSLLHLGCGSFLYVEIIKTWTASFSTSDLLLCCTLTSLRVCAHSCHLFFPLFVCKGPINSKLYPCSVSASDTSNGCKRCCQMRRGRSCMQLSARLHTPSSGHAAREDTKPSKRSSRIFSSGEPNKCRRVFVEWKCLHLRGGETKQRQKAEGESVFLHPRLSHCCPSQLWHWDLTWMLFLCKYHMWPHYV